MTSLETDTVDRVATAADTLDGDTGSGEMPGDLPASGDADDSSNAVPDELRPVPVGVAVLRHPFMFVLTIVVVVAAVGGIALARKPEYTGEARLLVGQVDAEARAVPGFTQATEDLASIYARVVTTNAVLEPAAKGAHVSLATARAALSASPIPGSSMVRIETTSKDDRTATKLAQIAAAALSKYVRSLNGGDPFQSSVYKQFQQVSADLAAAQVNQQSLQTQLNAAIGAATAGSATAPSNDQIANLQLQLTVATAQALQLKFKSDQLSIQFQNVNRVSGNTTELHLVAPAASQGSDRTSNLGLALVVALAAGILLGLALVTLRSNGPYLRSLRRRAADARA